MAVNRCSLACYGHSALTCCGHRTLACSRHGAVHKGLCLCTDQQVSGQIPPQSTRYLFKLLIFNSYLMDQQLLLSCKRLMQ